MNMFSFLKPFLCLTTGGTLHFPFKTDLFYKNNSQRQFFVWQISYNANPAGWLEMMGTANDFSNFFDLFLCWQWKQIAFFYIFILHHFDFNTVECNVLFRSHNQA